MEASRPSLGVRATGLVKQLFLSKRLKRLSTFEPFVSPTLCRFQVSPAEVSRISVNNFNHKHSQTDGLRNNLKP